MGQHIPKMIYLLNDGQRIRIKNVLDQNSTYMIKNMRPITYDEIIQA